MTVLEQRPVLFVNLWGTGGMKHYSDSLVQALHGGSPVVYACTHAPRPAAPLLPLDITLNPLRPRNWLELHRLRREIVRLNPRAVHLNSDHPMLVPLYPFLSRRNTVLTLHDAIPHRGERRTKRLFHALHLRALARWMPKLVVHSESVRAALPPALRARTSIVPHVEFTLWGGPVDRLREGSAGGPTRLLFFGRLLPYKGLDVLLEALDRLDPGAFELVVAGEGDVSGHNLSRPNIRVENRFIADEELARFFGEADLVVLPYHTASQSGVAHLAFAFGKPVIATRVGALAEVVNEGVDGLLVPPGEPAALAAAIRQASAPDTYTAFRDAIRRRYADADRRIRSRLLEVYALPDPSTPPTG